MGGTLTGAAPTNRGTARVVTTARWPTTPPYDGTLTHTMVVEALVVAMHVNTCSPTNSPQLCILDSDVHLTDASEVVNTPNALLDNTNNVIPACQYVLQPLW